MDELHSFCCVTAAIIQLNYILYDIAVWQIQVHRFEAEHQFLWNCIVSLCAQSDEKHLDDHTLWLNAMKIDAADCDSSSVLHTALICTKSASICTVTICVFDIMFRFPIRRIRLNLAFKELPSGVERRKFQLLGMGSGLYLLCSSTIMVLYPLWWLPSRVPLVWNRSDWTNPNWLPLLTNSFQNLELINRSRILETLITLFGHCTST